MVLVDFGATSLAHVLSHEFRQVCVGLAWLMLNLASVADCERRHKRTNTILHKSSMAVVNYMSKSMLEETRSTAVGSATRASQALEMAGLALPDIPLPIAKPKAKGKRQKKTSAFEQFKLNEIAESRVTGCGTDTRSLAFGGTLGAAYKALPAERKTIFEIEADNVNENKEDQRRAALAIADGAAASSERVCLVLSPSCPPPSPRPRLCWQSQERSEINTASLGIVAAPSIEAGRLPQSLTSPSPLPLRIQPPALGIVPMYIPSCSPGASQLELAQAVRDLVDVELARSCPMNLSRYMAGRKKVS